MTPAARTAPARADRTLWGDLALAAACALALVAVLYQAYAPARPAPRPDAPELGRVERSLQDVRRRARGVLTWDALHTGAPVHDEDAIYAAQDSQATLVLEDGARLVLDESSLVVVRRTPAPAQTPGAAPALALELVRGGARGHAGRGTLELRSGGARVAVGAAGEVGVRRAGEGAVDVEVAAGEATLVPGAGAGTVQLAAGQGARAARGGAAVTTLDVTLVAPGAGASVFTPGHSAMRGPAAAAPPLAFSWRAPAGAGPCTLEVAATADFATPLVRTRARGSAHAVPAPPPGVYHWRVTCEGGARSEQRTVRVRLDAPPQVLHPREGQSVDRSQGAPLALSWSALPDEPGYEVQVARDGRFEAPVLHVRPRAPVLQVAEALEEGSYCFRARAAREAPPAPWSPPTCFRVITRPVLDAPRVFEPRREAVPLPPPLPAPSLPGKGARLLLDLLLPTAHAQAPARSALVLRWEEIPGATGYLLEVAEDRAFRTVVVRERVREPYYRWNVVARRDYFWRVRGVDAHGREGELSEVSRIGSEVAPPPLEAPAPGARLELAAGAPVTLRWTGSPVLAAFRVELSPDPAFAREVRTLEAREPRLVLRDLPPGEHHWRVVGVDLHGQSTEPSRTRAFTVVPPPPAPRAPEAGARVVAEASPQPVQLAWEARPVARYQVEWGPTGEPPALATSTAPALELPVTRAASYTWRVRGLAPDTGWSAPATFEVALQPPTASAPGDGTELEAGVAAVLSWLAVPLAEGYEVELTPQAEGGEGAEPARVIPVRHTQLELGALTPGLYRWSVRVAGAPQLATPALALRVAALRVPPPPPVVLALAARPALGPALLRPAPPAPPRPRRLSLVAGAGVASNLGSLLAPAVHAEAAWRAPEAPLGAALRVSTFGAAQDVASAGLPGARVRLRAVPVELLAQHALDVAPRVALVASAGPVLRWVHASAALDGGTRVGATALELGGVVRGALELPVGPGRLRAELGLALTSATRDLVVTRPLTLGTGVGYRLEVW